jgi:hypothetical protein
MKARLACISSLILSLACTPEDQKIPSDILPIDSMKVLIWQMTMASEYAMHQKEEDTTIKTLNTAYFSEVLRLHHIDKNTFTHSYDFYQSHPALNKILFDSVTIYSEKQRAQIYKKRQ